MPTAETLAPEELAAAAELFRDVKLDPYSSEIVLVAGSPVFISGIEAIAQAARCNLRLFLGEWFDDETEGVPYLQRILDKGGAAFAGSAITARLLKSPGISRVPQLAVDFDAATRALTVDFSAVTDFGLLTDSIKVASK